MSRRALLIALMVGILGTLRSLAYASPPDPWWVPGLYDDADFDDVVALVTSAAAVVGPAAPVAPRLIPPVIMHGVLRDDARLPWFSTATLHARAPPSS
jgi:hypothetical protein